MRESVRKLIIFCNRHEWVMLLFMLVFALRIPTLFAPHYYGDEEIYFVMGRAWRMGIALYAQAFDHKPPLIYILAGITDSVFWFRTLLLGWMLIHTWLFWQLAKKFWQPLRPKLAYLSSLIFVVLTSLPTLEGPVANAELFMMMPLTASLLIIWEAKTKEYGRFFLAGLIAGVGLLFKVPIIFDFAGLLIYFFAMRQQTVKQGLASLISPSFWLYILGFVMPIIVTTINYYLKGTGTDYLRAALLINFGYISSWKTSSYAFNPFQSGLFVRTIILIGWTAVVYIARKKISKQLLLALMWVAYASFGALLSARPYPHYLLEPVVPFSLLIPFIFVIETAREWLICGVMVALAMVIQGQIGFGAYPTKIVYQTFWDYITHKIDKIEYRESFDNTKLNYPVAQYLQERMTNSDGLYVWGTDATIYNLTKTVPAGGKYIVSFHVKDFRAFPEVLAALSAKRPKYIVILPNPIEFAGLTTLLEQAYVEIQEIEGAKIFLRVER